MHWIDPSSIEHNCARLLTDRLSNDYVHNNLLIVTKVCMPLRNLVASSTIACEKTGSSLPILEVCGFQFWQFLGSGDHIFEQINTISYTHR